MNTTTEYYEVPSPARQATSTHRVHLQDSTGENATSLGDFFFDEQPADGDVETLMNEHEAVVALVTTKLEVKS